MTHRLPFKTRLRNGETVLIREVGPADRPLMREGFAKLSDQSRFFRFLAPHRDLSDKELDRFTEENTDEHFAIGALSVGVEADMPIATARFVRLEAGGTDAEIALTILDSHQRLGLGSLLLRTLSHIAFNRGINSFTALLHRDNEGMQALLRRFGGEKTSAGVEAEWRLPLPLPGKPKKTRSRGTADILIPPVPKAGL